MTRTPDAWTALRADPWRYLGSRWPWGALAYVVSTIPIGIAVLVVLATTLVVGAVTAVLVVGLVVLAGIPVLAGLLGVVERARLRLVQAAPPSGMSWSERLRAGRGLAVSWPEVGYAFLVSVVLWPIDFVVALVAITVPVVLLLAPWLSRVDRMEVLGWSVDSTAESWLAVAVGLVALAVSAYVVGLLAVAQAALARLLLEPRDAELVRAVAELRRSRVDLVDAFETERRRIERDLHDGVQQRLVALTMTLGSAELDVPDGPGLTLVRQAHRQAEEALEELRATVRGIHPRVLADHGLAAAVHEIADRSPVPVSVDIRLDERLPEPVETAAYFVVSEALTNVVRHSGARRAQVHGWRQAETFVLTVVDDGRGGAVLDRGTGSGLAGLAVRLDALGGELRVTSPAGGPTEVRMAAPCAA
ncbi:sensor histidine kinase [Nocardioides sp. LMS-CY]|uniref:sensor histidine kinase n=1 Tax=Nocardioides sp. (strain LMS-CY) TaxID=2840457 RepID=UPI001C007867|nr:sensor histidine kinase [Nocardioides sp. LMS-CY]QWF21964.1 sensor histidine kinase [Nocardioides sp. LMS-CY]